MTNTKKMTAEQEVKLAELFKQIEGKFYSTSTFVDIISAIFFPSLQVPSGEVGDEEIEKIFQNYHWEMERHEHSSDDPKLKQSTLSESVQELRKLFSVEGKSKEVTPTEQKEPDGCKDCLNNKSGVENGLFCINNCINGSKFSPLPKQTRPTEESVLDIIRRLCSEVKVKNHGGGHINVVDEHQLLDTKNKIFSIFGVEESKKGESQK